MLPDSLQAKPAPPVPVPRDCSRAPGCRLPGPGEAPVGAGPTSPGSVGPSWSPPKPLGPAACSQMGSHAIPISMELLLWAGPREWHPTHKQTDAFPTTLDLACSGRLSFELCAGHRVSSGDRDIVLELVRWSHNLVTILKATESDTFKRVNFMACDLCLSF